MHAECVYFIVKDLLEDEGGSRTSLQLDPVYSALQKYSPLLTFGTFCCAIKLFHNAFIQDSQSSVQNKLFYQT